MIDYGNVYEAILADNRQMRQHIVELERQVAERGGWEVVDNGVYSDGVWKIRVMNRTIGMGIEPDGSFYGGEIPDGWQLMRRTTASSSKEASE